MSDWETRKNGQCAAWTAATVLCADIRGYSLLAQAPENAPLLREFHTAFGGVTSTLKKMLPTEDVVKKANGDGIVIVDREGKPGEQIARALHYAATILATFPNQAGADWIRYFRPRIALHHGKAFKTTSFDEDDAYGADVVTAARLEPVVMPGIVLVTSSFHRLAQKTALANSDSAKTISSYVFEPVGKTSLAKSWPSEFVYQAVNKNDGSSLHVRQPRMPEDERSFLCITIECPKSRPNPFAVHLKFGFNHYFGEHPVGEKLYCEVIRPPEGMPIPPVRIWTSRPSIVHVEDQIRRPDEFLPGEFDLPRNTPEPPPYRWHEIPD